MFTWDNLLSSTRLAQLRQNKLENRNYFEAFASDYKRIITSPALDDCKIKLKYFL